MTDYLQNIIAFFHQTHNQTTSPGRLIRLASVSLAAYIQQVVSPSLYPAQASGPTSIYSEKCAVCCCPFFSGLRRKSYTARQPVSSSWEIKICAWQQSSSP
jgi:hypothetical protein